MKKIILCLLLIVLCSTAYCQTRPSWFDLKDRPPALKIVDFIELGADNTGATDVTDLLHAAIASGGYLYLPHGDYKISAEDNGRISVDDSIVIFGPGRLVVDSSSYTYRAIGIDLTASNTYAIIDGITIEGSNQLHFGIDIYTANTLGNGAIVNGCKVSNLHAQNRTGIDVAGVVINGEFATIGITHNTISTVVRQEPADNSRSANGILVAGGAQMVNISNNAISDIRSSPTNVDYGNADGIAVFTAAKWSTAPRDGTLAPGSVLIENNELYNCEGRFVKVAAPGAVVLGNKFVHDSGTSMASFEGVVVLRGACSVSDNTYIIGSSVTLGVQYSCFAVYQPELSVTKNAAVSIKDNKVYLFQALGNDQRVFFNSSYTGNLYAPLSVTIQGNFVLGEGGARCVMNGVTGSGTESLAPVTVQVLDNIVEKMNAMVFWADTNSALATYSQTLAAKTIVINNTATGSAATDYLIHTSPETNAVGRIGVSKNTGWNQTRVTVGDLQLDHILDGSEFYYIPGSGGGGLTVASGTMPASYTGALNGVFIEKNNWFSILARYAGTAVLRVKALTLGADTYFSAEY